MEQIEWTEVRDRHCEGWSREGRLWIRLDPESKVTGIYTDFGSMEKWVPEPGESLSLEDGKIQAEFLLAAKLAADRLMQN